MLAHAAFGLSGSMLYSPATAVAGHWFMHRRSTAVGIVVCGSGLAGVIYPIALNRLTLELSSLRFSMTDVHFADLILDFRDAVLIIAGINAILMFPSWFTLKARLPPRTSPPFKSLRLPWRESRYACLVIGSSFIMAKYVAISSLPPS